MSAINEIVIKYFYLIVGNVLIFGCLRQNIELMCGMLYLGANIEHRNKHGDTSLMIAAKRGHLVVVQVLLKNGCNINAYNDKNMESALTYACLYKGNVKMVQLLLESGADMVYNRFSIISLKDDVY